MPPKMGATPSERLSMPSRKIKQQTLHASRAFIEEHFGTIWPIHLSAFARLLAELRARFDGDLDLLLILAVIGDRTRPENWTPELLSYRQLTRGPGEENLQYPINMQSVADYSGIPRETVRRKVGTLQKMGWIQRDAEGRLTVSRKAAQDLEDATSVSIEYLAAILTAFQSAGVKRGQT